MSGTNTKQNDRILYLEEIYIESGTKKRFQVELQIDGHDIEMRYDRQSSIWKPLQNLDLTSAMKIMVIIKPKSSVGWSSSGKLEARVEVTGLEVIKAFWELRTLIITTTYDNRPATVNVKPRPSLTLETIYGQIIKVQEATTQCTTRMEESTEQEITPPIKYGVSLGETSPMAKVAFGLVKATFDTLKEQNKYDESVSNLTMTTGRVLPFADRVLEDALCDEAEILETVIKSLCKLIVETATFTCDYVRKHSINGLLDSPTRLQDGRLMRDLWIRSEILEEDLNMAISGSALKATNSTEKDFLLKRLGPIEDASYQNDRGCMKGTRTQVINDTILWATEKLNDGETGHFNVNDLLWIYGMPGIGKTAVAHSICHRLHESRQFGGSFFCRRDDRARSETKSVLPTLMYRLATMFGPYRSQVAQALREDPQTTLQSADGEFFLHTLQSLKVHPLRTFVLVIDALDECGAPATRKQLLGYLLKACRLNTWLKAVLISRPEHDIRLFFDGHGVIGRDLGQDDQSRTDIRQFTKVRMKMVADERHVSQHPEPWIGERRLGRIVNRSGGLFLFVETLSQYLMKYRNPKPPLDRLLEGPSEEASIELHKLYLAAIESRVNSEDAESRLIARAVIGVAPHRALCDEAIAAFTGLELGVVNSWVDDLSSLLYRDHTLQGGIRVRHMSILEYFAGPFCPLDFRVDVKQANIELGSYCLQTMMAELRFNICKLDTSYRANSEIEDLNERVKSNISDILQYSCLYWSNHLCSSLDLVSKEVSGYLGAFLRGERLLYWLEALSVMEKVPAAIGALRNIISCRKIFEEEIVNLAEGALRFVLAFLTPITTSAPHIYLSVLPFTPSESSLWKGASKLFPKRMRVSEGRMTKWPRIGAVWKGHATMVTGVAYSPDGLNVVSGSFDRTVRIWDVATGTPVGEPLKGHAGAITSVACSPDGRSIVSGSWDNTIRIWDATTGTPIGDPLIGHTSTVSSVSCSPDSRNIVSGSDDNTIRIWDAATGTPVGKPLKGHTKSVISVEYSPDGRHIISGSEDNTIRIWDATTGTPVGQPLKGHTKSVTSVAYSPNGRNIVSGSWDNTVRMWNTATGKIIGEPLKGHTKGVTSVAYSPDGRSIVSGAFDDTIRIWDATTGVPTAEPLTGHNKTVRSVAYSPDGRNIVSGSDDKTIRLWDASMGVLIGESSTGHTKIANSVIYSPDGQNVVTGSHDCTIRIWDAATGTLVGEPLKGHTKGVTSVTYSPDGRTIASGSFDDTIRIWDPSTGMSIAEPLAGHSGGVRSVAYSPNGRNIVSGSGNNTSRIWDVVTGAPVGEPLKGHLGYIASVAYSPDGQHIVSGSNDSTIRIWDAATGAPAGDPLKGHIGSIASVVYSPDGRHIVSGSSDKTIRIWNAATGKLVGEPLKGHTKGVTSVVYSPNGRSIVSGSRDDTIRIWDAATGAPIGDPLNGHSSWIASVAYSPDCRHIASGSFDQTICVWDARQISNTDRIVLSAHLDLPPQILDTLSFNPSDSNAVSSIALNPKSIDSEGWVRCDDGILMWIPEDCRRGVTSHAIRTIPPEVRQRRVRLDLSNFKYGKSWTHVYCDI